MAHRLKEVPNGRPDPLGWAVGRDQLGVLLLEPNQLCDQGIELSIRDRRIVQYVIAVEVLVDLGTELLDPRLIVRHRC
jgi:hypothetical protein